VFEQVTALVRKAPLAADRSVLLELLALRDAVDARLTELVGTFDEAALWELDAATSMAAWLTDHAHLAVRTARALTVRAARLRHAPDTLRRWHDGQLHGGQIEMVASHLGGHRTALWADHERGLAATLVGLCVDDTARVLADWHAHADADGAEPADTVNRLFHSRTAGRYHTNGTFAALDREIITTALRVATRTDHDDDEHRSAAERRADALVAVCRYFLDHQTTRPTRRHRPHLKWSSASTISHTRTPSTAPPSRRSPPTSTKRSPSAIDGAASPVATVRRHGAMPTTSDGPAEADRRRSPTSSCCAAAITAGFTNATGTRHSHSTARSP